MSDVQGTPSSEAPDTSIASPNLDLGNPDGSGSSTGTDDEVVSLRSKVEELEKRFSGSTSSWQNEKKRADTLESRLNKWKEAGIDLDEIDRIVGSQGTTRTSGPANTGNPSKSFSPEEIDGIVNQKLVLRDWEAVKEDFLEKNPDYDTRAIRKFIDAAGAELAQEEINSTGKMVSSPRQVFKKAIAEFEKVEARTRKRLEKEMSETREKIKGQGVTETEHRKAPVVTDTDKDYQEMSNDEYLGFFRNLGVNARRTPKLE